MGIVLIFMSLWACQSSQEHSGQAMMAEETALPKAEVLPEASGAYTDTELLSEVPAGVSDKLTSLVEGLPEFQQANSDIDSATRHTHGASVIFEPPGKELPEYYYLRVGYSGPERFETYYHFYVNPETEDIRIEDMLKGDIVPLATWRKRQRLQGNLDI